MTSGYVRKSKPITQLKKVLDVGNGRKNREGAQVVKKPYNYKTTMHRRGARKSWEGGLGPGTDKVKGRRFL